MILKRDEQKRIIPTYSGTMILVRTYDKPDQKLNFIENFLYKRN